ncbi:MAG TPA: hypothetical protein VGM86_30635 [Thermoanaerobaculia bacterium]|jgi:hypothetical protein
MKKTLKNLKLAKETLGALDRLELEGVAGGATVTCTSSLCTKTCTTSHNTCTTFLC